MSLTTKSLFDFTGCAAELKSFSEFVNRDDAPCFDLCPYYLVHVVAFALSYEFQLRVYGLQDLKWSSFIIEDDKITYLKVVNQIGEHKSTLLCYLIHFLFSWY